MQGRGWLKSFQGLLYNISRCSHGKGQEGEVLAAQHGQPGAAQVLGGLIGCDNAIELPVHILRATRLLKNPAALLHSAALHQAVGCVWQEDAACNTLAISTKEFRHSVPQSQPKPCDVEKIKVLMKAMFRVLEDQHMFLMEFSRKYRCGEALTEEEDGAWHSC